MEKFVKKVTQKVVAPTQKAAAPGSKEVITKKLSK